MRLVAAACALAWLAVAAWLSGSYGPVWDCVMGEYPHGEAAWTALTSDAEYQELCMGDTGARPRQPHPFFDPGVRLPWHGTYPLTGIASAVSCRVLWTGLGLVPPLQAHNFPVLLLVALLLYVMVRTAGERFGLLAGVASALLLVCAPRFFAHSFNNLKDVPEAVLYGLATLGLYLALTRGGLRRWIPAGAVVGLALAQRPNALFVPVQMFLFLVGALILRRRPGSTPLPWSWTGLAAALLTFLLVYFLGSPGFWAAPFENAWDQLLYHLRFNAHFNDRGDVTVPLDSFDPGISTHGLLLFVGSTPPSILLLALLGLAHPRLRGEERLFLLLGVAVPVGRTLLHGMVNYDGVRHFLEAFPPLAVLAGLGLAHAVGTLRRVLAPRGPRAASWAPAALATALCAGPVHAVVSTHPNGIAYYNAFLGGLSGAQARGIPDATDYWGNAYWQGLDWLARHAEPGAGLVAPLATHVVRCSLPVRAPDGPALLTGAEPTPVPVVYLMYVTRVPTYGPVIRAFDGRVEPALEILCQGAPVLRILRLEGEDAREAQALLGREGTALVATRSILVWLREHPAEAPAVMQAVIDPEAREGDALRRLEALLPPELHEEARELLWTYRR